MSPVDFKHISEGKREALEVTEAARETEWLHPSFVAELFMGRFHRAGVFPYPEQHEADRRIGDEYLAQVEAFLRAQVDPDQIDQTGEMPPEVIQGLVRLGCFGMKIPKEYGGLGLSQVNYNRTIALVASYCGSTAVWLSAHQSIGVPQPLKLFGTEEQKRRYLPRLASGTISAFALTEPDVGSDPAKMKTTATPVDGGEAYLLNGDKLWCTNGPKADLLIVMARTPSIVVNGKERQQITAFIVERSMPGFEVVHRCDFMGIRGIQNGLLRFTNVKVPKEHILWGLGQGLKLALITLNTGRLTLPAGCVGVSKRCLTIARRWTSQRVQWGAAIAKHELIADKLADTAALTFAMEAVTWFASGLVDRGGADIRLEAAMTKLFCSESSWRIVDETLQMRGGRGYETAPSLRGRGEPGYPVERLMRDARINTIIEGASEILRLFLAREALDAHMRIAGDLLNPRRPAAAKVRAALKAACFYSAWYPYQWIGGRWTWLKYRDLDPMLARHLRCVEGTSHRLARAVFHSMLRYQLQLERKQLTLARLVNIGTELFAMAAVCSRTHMLLRRQPEDQTPRQLTDLFCREARRRIADEFRGLRDNDDRHIDAVANDVMAGRMRWLETGIVNEPEPTV